MSWGDFFNGGRLGGQMQGEGMGGLEKLILMLQQRSKDATMRGMWGTDGSNMPRPQFQPEAPDMWKEMLQRQMWQHINRTRPGQQMGVNGEFPMKRMPWDGKPNQFKTMPDNGEPTQYLELLGRRG